VESVTNRVRRPSRAAAAGGVLARLVGLVVIVGLVGVGVGFAVGYPVSRLDVGAQSAVALDHLALAGTFDPEAALVAPDDLPGNWSPADPGFGRYTMIGQPVCGQTPDIANQLGDTLVRVFQDDRNRSFIISEVVRVRQPKDANQYLRELEKVFGGCRRFYRGSGEERTQVRVLAGQPDPPVVDYVSRSLQPVTGGSTQRLIFMQVADVIVSIQYIGPTVPPRALLDRAQREILTRVAPEQFARTRDIPGARPIPTEPTTTTTSTTTTLPPTTLPPSTTTTVKRRPRPTTTKPAPATTPPPQTVPAAGGNGE
jgi:hypothetical protein